MMCRFCVKNTSFGPGHLPFLVVHGPSPIWGYFSISIQSEGGWIQFNILPIFGIHVVTYNEIWMETTSPLPDNLQSWFWSRSKQKLCCLGGVIKNLPRRAQTGLLCPCPFHIGLFFFCSFLLSLCSLIFKQVYVQLNSNFASVWWSYIKWKLSLCFIFLQKFEMYICNQQTGLFKLSSSETVCVSLVLTYMLRFNNFKMEHW